MLPPISKLYPVLYQSQEISHHKGTIVKPVLTTTFLKRPPALNDHVVVLP